MKYIIASTAVTDEIHFVDGKRTEIVAGGAGVYALCGVKLWSDDVMLVTGWEQIFQAFMENGIKTIIYPWMVLLKKMIKHRIQLFSILKMEKEKKRHVMVMSIIKK